MKMLLPIDGSKSALKAKKYAAQLAKNSRSPAVITLDILMGSVAHQVAYSYTS